MKVFIKSILAFSLLTSIALAAPVNYKILRGAMHKGGSLKLTSKINATDSHKTDFSIDYKIVKKVLAPIPRKWLSGKYTETFPAEFTHEEFYMNLRAAKTLKVDDMVLTHKGMITIGRYTNAHKVHIVIDGGDVDVAINAYYHPTIEHMGWVKFDIYVTKIPVIGTYRVKAEILK